MPDIVTAERGAPNLLYPGDANLLGDYLTVTADRPILPIPIALRDAPTWYESAYEGTDVATGATIGGTERLTWGQYKGEVDDTYQITPFDVDGDGNMDLVVGNRDQTAKVYFNAGTKDCNDTPNAFPFLLAQPIGLPDGDCSTAIDLGNDPASLCESTAQEIADGIYATYWASWTPPAGFEMDALGAEICPATCAIYGVYAPGCAPTDAFEPKFEFRTKLGEPYDTGPSAVGVDTTEHPAVDTTGLATAVDLNGDG